MKKGKRIAIFLADSGMELCWLFGWVAFLLYTMKYKLSFPVVLYVFGSGCAVSVLGRSLRRPISLIALRASVFIGIYSLLMQSVLKAGFQGWPLAWISALTDERRSAESWIFIILYSTLMIGIFWRGVLKPCRPANGENINGRFDLGLGAFFVLFIIKILVSSKGVPVPGYPHFPALFIPYFLLSLLALGLVRNRNAPSTYYGPRFHQIIFAGIFSLAVLALGASIFGLFHSHLTSGADRFLVSLKPGGEVLTEVFVSIIRFILMHRARDPGPLAPASDPSKSIPLVTTGDELTTGNEVSLLEQGMVYGVVGLALAGTFLLAGAFLWVVVKYLFRKQEKTAPGTLRLQNLKVFFRGVHRCLEVLVDKARRWLRGFRSGIDLYTTLVAWGRRSGIDLRKTDTPLEYGRRLGESFPGLKREVGSIVALVNLELFGEAVLTKEDLAPGLAAWKELRKPKYWPLRLKTGLFSSNGGFQGA